MWATWPLTRGTAVAVPLVPCMTEHKGLSSPQRLTSSAHLGLLAVEAWRQTCRWQSVSRSHCHSLLSCLPLRRAWGQLVPQWQAAQQQTSLCDWFGSWGSGSTNWLHLGLAGRAGFSSSLLSLSLGGSRPAFAFWPS